MSTFSTTKTRFPRMSRKNHSSNLGHTAVIESSILDSPVKPLDTTVIPVVVMTAEAREQFAALPSVIRARVYKLTDRLKKWPEVSGPKPLRGQLAGRYRIRTGDYRLQFRVQGAKVIVERIGHRDGFYED